MKRKVSLCKKLERPHRGGRAGIDPGLGETLVSQHYFFFPRKLTELTISLVSPQTITGLLQEFDVQASRGSGSPSPFPALSSLFPSSFHWLKVRCSDTGGKWREGSCVGWFSTLSFFSPERAGLSSGQGSKSMSLPVKAGRRC